MIKLAIVGTGGIAHWHAEHFQKINDVSFVAACDVDEKINNLKIISLEAKSKRLKSNGTLYTTEKPKIINNKIKLIPYFCWSNRKENKMIVWINES